MCSLMNYSAVAIVLNQEAGHTLTTLAPTLFEGGAGLKSIITVMKYLRLQGIPVPFLIGSK